MKKTDWKFTWISNIYEIEEVFGYRDITETS